VQHGSSLNIFDVHPSLHIQDQSKESFRPILVGAASVDTDNSQATFYQEKLTQTTVQPSITERLGMISSRPEPSKASSIEMQFERVEDSTRYEIVRLPEKKSDILNITAPNAMSQSSEMKRYSSKQSLKDSDKGSRSSNSKKMSNYKSIRQKPPILAQTHGEATYKRAIVDQSSSTKARSETRSASANPSSNMTQTNLNKVIILSHVNGDLDLSNDAAREYVSNQPLKQIYA